MVKFKEFNIEDVLTWQSQKEIDPLKIKDLTVNRNYKYPFYGQATINNGIISYLTLTDKVLNNKDGKPTLLIHSNNQNIVYLETPFYLKDGHGATSVLQSDFLNRKIALYIMTCIRKVISRNFTYNQKATKIALKHTVINLPVSSNDEIDYNYMEKYIELIENNLNNLKNNFLVLNGLDKPKITNEDKITLEKYKYNKLKSFLLNEIFISESGNTDIQQYHINGKGCYVITSGKDNNGILGKSDIKAKILSTNTISIDMFGNVNFRNFEYKMVTHARVFSLKFKNRELTEEEGLYLTTQLFYLDKMFSYNNMATWEKIRNLNIDLPITENGDIDFDFMKSFINVQKKIILKKIKKVE